MHIEKMTLINFRNYENQTVEFDNSLNVVFGKNASGKTNLIESIYCCAIGKSPRTSKFRELVKWGKEFAHIKISLVKKYRKYVIDFAIDGSDKKRVAIDGVPLTKISELLGLMNVVYFSPDELKLIKDSPTERRRFMDISLSQQSKSYFYELSQYNTIIDQRNKLLKSGYEKNKLEQMLFAWDSQLAKIGAKIIAERFEFIKHLSVFAEQIHSVLTDGKEKLQLKYETKIKMDSKQIMQQELMRIMSEQLDKDMRLQYTSVGAHRDDIAILTNDIDVRKFGSQGQQRTSALSLKLAEIGLFKQQIGETPILLLDDVLSELDESRRNKLMQLASGMQTIITCTEFDMDIKNKSIHVNEGKIINNQ